jgi:phospholipid transport system substrate-binding protein
MHGMRWISALLRCGASTLTLAAVLMAVSASAAAQPAEPVTRLQQALISAMKTGGGNYDKRLEMLEPVINEVFDAQTMTRIATGPHWARLSKAERRELTDTFSRFITASHAGRFDDYNGQQFETLNVREAGTTVIVETELRGPNDEVRLNYVVRRFGNAWRIIDVVARGSISELALRRAEFTDVIASEGADALIARLQERIQAQRN